MPSIVVTVSILGLLVATHVATRTVRDTWKESHDRVLAFCCQAADATELVLIEAARAHWAGSAGETASAPAVGTEPPFRASLLSYFRDGLMGDVYTVAGPTYTASARANDWAFRFHQIEDVVVELYLLWETRLGVTLNTKVGAAKWFTAPAPIRDPDYLVRRAHFLRERLTLTHQEFGRLRPPSRPRALVRVPLTWRRKPRERWLREHVLKGLGNLLG